MNWDLQTLIILLLSAFCFGQQIKDDDDPCLAGKYSTLNEVSRSTGYDLRPSDTPLCDNKIKKGWYTFTGRNGNPAEIATTCPGTDTCGTSNAIWMNGPHPTVKEGIVTRPMCAQLKKGDPNCCELEDELFVKNCGTFYVYYLSKQQICPTAYCAGTDKRCPVGKWSDSNFEPCKDPGLILDKPPRLIGLNVHSDKSIDYVCQIEYTPTDPKQNFEVVWTINGNPEPSIKPVILTGAQRSVKLTGDDLKKFADSELGCQVTTYYTGLEHQKNTYKSSSSYFGVKTATLTGPRLIGTREFKFECQFEPAPSDTDQKAEVVWLFNGVEDPKIPRRILNGKKTITGLDGYRLAGHMNTNIECQVRLVYDKSEFKTKFIKSASYFAGIKITPTTIDISVTEEEKQVTVTSTLPPVCEEGKKCCLRFSLNVDQKTVVSLKSSCDYTICLTDWKNDKKEASTTFTLVPGRNSIAAGTRSALLSFGEITITGSGSYISLFKEVRPNPIQILIRLKDGSTCSITGDPHITASDNGIMYHLYQLGDYTAWEAKYRDFSVQIRTWRCWAVTCVCGVVIKERNDIINVFGCNNPGNLYAATINIPYALTPGVVVQRSSNGANIAVLLASGSSIRIEVAHFYMNVYITIPAYDIGKVLGLCGKFDGIQENDYTAPDGTVHTICTGQPCFPNAFMQSWRVWGSKDMFLVTPPKVEKQVQPPTEFCSCTVDGNGKSQYTCSPRQHIQDNQNLCPNCDVVNDLEPEPWDTSDQEKEPLNLPPVDPNKKWPNVNGVTEAQAKVLCNNAIQKSPVFERCKNDNNIVNGVTNECMGDILFGGTTDALKAVTASFTSKCQLELAKDENNFVRDKDGNLKLKPEISDFVCHVDCEGHGKCGRNGKCDCNGGWKGDTCQIDDKKGPQILFIKGPGCSSKKTPCDSVEFSKTNVDNRDKVKCRVQEVNEQGVKTGKVHILEPVTAAGNKVACPFPPTTGRKKSIPEGNFQRFSFSISTDDINFGNELVGVTVDNSCLVCEENECKERTNVCRINKFCYANGAVNKKNDKQICDVQKNPKNWSQNKSC